MRIQSIDNRTNFGNLCGIRCNESFRNGTYGYTDQRALLINDLMESKAFKDLGEKLDYDAVFNFNYDVFNFRTGKDDCYSYELKLVPAEQPTPGKKLPNLPIEIPVLECEEEGSSEAYNTFRKELNNLTGSKLSRKVKKGLRSEVKRLRAVAEGKKYDKEVKNAKKNIRNSDIPIDFNV